ncbi:DUF6950 family protein [Granulicella paludicola]|uniref:DUF6950 family protein n=1 Tax=Granulicella paludicola TaxID=474951 RepID=UPI0021DF8EE2|nr:hypothetical protein [Granulicella paludicola]
MPIKRTEHWATRELDQYLRDHAKDEFRWGVQDCCLFAANSIEAMTGVDIADDFRGKYNTQAQAFALIKSLTGGATVADAAAHCATKHGLTEWSSPLLAQRGDLVVIQDGDQLIAGIVHLNGRHVISIGAGGLKRLSIRNVTRAWKV